MGQLYNCAWQHHGMSFKDMEDKIIKKEREIGKKSTSGLEGIQRNKRKRRNISSTLVTERSKACAKSKEKEMAYNNCETWKKKGIQYELNEERGDNNITKAEYQRARN